MPSRCSAKWCWADESTLMQIPLTRRDLQHCILHILGNPIVLKLDRPCRLDADYALHLGQLRRAGMPQDVEWLLQYLRNTLGDSYNISQNNGYLNFSMTESLLKSQIYAALDQGATFGATGQQNNKRISAEFVSADPVGPLSINHGRMAILGDALCRLLKWQGARVTREYFINDDESSSRLNLLGESIKAMYAKHFGENPKLPEGMLDTSFVRQVTNEIIERDGNQHLHDDAGTFAHDACQRAIYMQQQSLRSLDVPFDLWVYETTLIEENRVPSTVNQLRDKDAIYERDGVTWIAASRWGDTLDRPLVRQDGTPTYLATDTAYHLYRLERGYDTLISIWGSEHRQYVKRTHAALQAVGYDENRLKVLLCASVQWANDGVILPEEETPATVDEALTILEASTLRLALLLSENDKAVVLDREILSRDNEENPVYQLQLLPARLAQLKREATAKDIAENAWNDAQHKLAQWVAQWLDEVELATAQLAPQRIAIYLQQGATIVRELLKVHRSGQPLDEDLIAAAAQIAQNGFNILGVETSEQL